MKKASAILISFLGTIVGIVALCLVKVLDAVEWLDRWLQAAWEENQ